MTRERFYLVILLLLLMLSAIQFQGCIHLTHRAKIENGWQVNVSLAAVHEKYNHPDQYAASGQTVDAQISIGAGRAFDGTSGMMWRAILTSRILTSGLDVYWQLGELPLSWGLGAILSPEPALYGMMGKYWTLPDDPAAEIGLDFGCSITSPLAADYGRQTLDFSIRPQAQLSLKTPGWTYGVWSGYQRYSETIKLCDEGCTDKRSYLDDRLALGFSITRIFE